MSKEIRVWDPLVRIFHWGLVAAFTLAYLTGEEESAWHVYSGYAVLGLVAFRLVWGLVGTKYARFGNFLAGPAKVRAYLKSLLARRPKIYTGHNPAGGWMIVMLLISLVVTCVSGLKVYALEQGKGPFASVGAAPSSYAVAQLFPAAHAEPVVRGRPVARDSDEKDKEGEEWWEEIHEFAANFTLLLIFLHIVGVTVSSVLERQNLVKAMITGKKRTEE